LSIKHDKTFFIFFYFFLFNTAERTLLKILNIHIWHICLYENNGEKGMRTKTNGRLKLFFTLLVTSVFFGAMIAPMMIIPQSSAVTWDPPPIGQISTDKRKNQYERYPAIAAESGKVYAVWAENDGKDYNIMYREHDGAAWQTDEEISASDMNIEQWYPDIAVDGGDVHVVWQDSVNGGWDIMYRKKTGLVWGSITEISSDVSIEVQWYPKVAASGGNVYAVWQDGRDGDWDIYFTYHNGVSWSLPAQVNTDSGTEDQTYPCIAAGGGNAYVVWVDEGGGDSDIKMRVFDGSWGTIREVSVDSTNQDQEEPEVAYDGGVLHLVWQEIITDRDILYRNWDGAVFSSIVEVSIDSGTEFQNVPSIAAQFGIVHFVWADSGDGDWDIVYRQYNGTAWLTPQEISADVGTEDQWFPDIATENGVVHVVWEDPSPGDGEAETDIFYRKGNETVVDTFPPDIKSVLLDGLNELYIQMGTSSVLLTAMVDDSATGGSTIGGANYTWGPENWGMSIPMTSDDGLNSSEEGFHATLDTSSLGLGTYLIYVYGWDNIPNKNTIGTFATLIVVPAINLEEGWNLISFPQEISNTSLINVLASIDGDYDAVQYYNASETNDLWKHYQISKPSDLNYLDEMDNEKGFWVHVTAVGGTTLVIEGILPSNPHDISLSQGWNHVGYPSLTNRQRTAALNNLAFDNEVDAVWTHNATTQQWEEVGEFDYIEYGRGYWIHATIACTWTVAI
jgi:hypothetical protein